MIELKGTHLIRYGERIGYVMGDVAFLFKQVSDAERRRIQVVSGADQFVFAGEVGKVVNGPAGGNPAARI